MQLIGEIDFETETANEFDLDTSLHDSSVKIINYDSDKQIMDIIDFVQSDIDYIQSVLNLHGKCLEFFFCSVEWANHKSKVFLIRKGFFVEKGQSPI